MNTRRSDGPISVEKLSVRWCWVQSALSSPVDWSNENPPTSPTPASIAYTRLFSGSAVIIDGRNDLLCDVMSAANGWMLDTFASDWRTATMLSGVSEGTAFVCIATQFPTT